MSTTPKRIESDFSEDRYSKQPYDREVYADNRGVVDFGNLLQFAPYESGYCFLSVLSSPKIWKNDNGTRLNRTDSYQQAFIQILEQEFRGLSGIEDISIEITDTGSPTVTIPYALKINSLNVGNFTMNFTEKSGSLITKYISKYLRTIRTPYSNIKSYNGYININNAYEARLNLETFDLLYIITDSTCFNVEKAFLILNAQPTTAAYSEIYNINKGEISTREITVPWSACVREGAVANRLGQIYLNKLIGTVINLDSYDYNWSISGIDDNVIKSTKLMLSKKKSTGKYAFGDSESFSKYTSYDNHYKFNKSSSYGDDWEP